MIRKARTLVLLAAATFACSPSPNAAFARKVEQAASWAAAAEFADSMRTAGRVPQGYIEDLFEHGAEDVAELEKQVSADEHMPASVRSRASTLCARLAAAFRTSTEAKAANVGELRTTGAELRRLAVAVRSGAADEAAGAVR
jgi:hypothetical protein